MRTLRPTGVSAFSRVLGFPSPSAKLEEKGSLKKPCVRSALLEPAACHSILSPAQLDSGTANTFLTRTCPHGGTKQLCVRSSGLAEMWVQGGSLHECFGEWVGDALPPVLQWLVTYVQWCVESREEAELGCGNSWRWRFCSAARLCIAACADDGFLNSAMLTTLQGKGTQ